MKNQDSSNITMTGIEITDAHTGKVLASYYPQRAAQESDTSKHTPAPWILKSGGVIRNGNKGFVITEVTQPAAVADLRPEESEANARLIAAAPELYAALKRWQDEWVIGGTTAQTANNVTIAFQINHALAKARGDM